jgi:hypothetical protein
METELKEGQGQAGRKKVKIQLNKYIKKRTLDEGRESRKIGESNDAKDQ